LFWGWDLPQFLIWIRQATVKRGKPFRSNVRPCKSS